MRQPAPRRHRHDAERGFSFLEMIVVMGMVAVLFGLSIGYLTGAGTKTQLDQARAMLEESARRCQNASIGGGRKAVFIVQESENLAGDTLLQVAASVAQPVLTVHFEQLDNASSNIPTKNHGVKVAAGRGKHGSAGYFRDGSHLEFDRQSRFAMTEGFELDVYVDPDGDGRTLTILRGYSDEGDLYRVALTRVGDSRTYDVKMTLRLRRAGAGRDREGAETSFQTRGGPVRADRRLQHLQVSFDGMEASIRVDGLEMLESAAGLRRRAPGLDETQVQSLRRLAAPASGLVSLSISATDSPFKGLLDSLQLRGVFASDEMQRLLPEALQVRRPDLPVRVTYVNGVLDPDLHDRDVLVEFGDTVKPDDLPLVLRLGRNGTIESRYGSFRTGPGGTQAATETDGAAEAGE